MKRAHAQWLMILTATSLLFLIVLLTVTLTGHGKYSSGASDFTTSSASSPLWTEILEKLPKTMTATATG
ncbi:hypothetical protein Pyn_11261 [Prunus yedoensis var. nudiflora]|uniref:Uncharacterized protein n=1 Tax=Prunus yedoensis var. nudiflora TaxID=2094558 RepID=A0A314UJ76_PRUYE|nr:hypothetical protein Pyn_11261 [Prunus yedoensis var. nudiflora]